VFVDGFGPTLHSFYTVSSSSCSRPPTVLWYGLVALTARRVRSNLRLVVTVATVA